MFFLIIISLIFYIILNPIYKSNEIIITYGLKPFNIATDNQKLWEYIKIAYVVSFLIANTIYINYIYTHIICRLKEKEEDKNIEEEKNEKLRLLIGQDEKNGKNVYVPESGLYQNFLITGTIGSGKTSSAMYPFTRTIIKI